MATIKIDPINRMEGHMAAECVTQSAENGGVRVTGAYLHGNLFRGFEQILKARDPRDAMILTQRICGVCPIGHGTASSNNTGTLLGYKVHYEDNLDPIVKAQVPQATLTLPANANRLKNLVFCANHLMSHILHFYHLVALDYVNTGLNRPFLCPRYDAHYYITTARILAVAPLLPPAAVATLSSLPGWNVDPGKAVNNYLVGQYLKALDIRRICHEMGAIYGGKMPCAATYTPGGSTATIDRASVTNYRDKLTQVLAFIGQPTDFVNGVAGTMMFDTVAAAHLFLEYFWIGNSYGQFMSNGLFETGFVDGVSDFTAHVLLKHTPNPDNRGFRRGYRLNAKMPYDGSGNFIPPTALDIMKIGESIASSRYNKKVDGNYPDGKAFKHPWDGLTEPLPDNEYSWLKSPRYDTGAGYQVFEVGPLSRQVVQGNYFAGVLNALGYVNTPAFGDLGPDLGKPPAQGGHPLYAAYPGGGPDLSGVSYIGDSVIDRIGARTVETLLIGLLAQSYLNALEGTIGADGYGLSGCTNPAVPVTTTEKKGYGMTEASRGALSHWVKMVSGKITAYQCVVPTTWNGSPRDVNNNPGPAEKSLMNNGGVWVKDPNQPIEIIRVTHSYDFCIACAVHLITPKGDVKKVIIPPVS